DVVVLRPVDREVSPPTGLLQRRAPVGRSRQRGSPATALGHVLGHRLFSFSTGRCLPPPFVGSSNTLSSTSCPIADSCSAAATSTCSARASRGTIMFTFVRMV